MRQNPPETWGTGTTSSFPLFNIGTPSVKQPLSPQEDRGYQALKAHPEGLKSYELRSMARCSYAASLVQRIVDKGYAITMTMESDGFNSDGSPTFIGRYRLVDQRGQI